MILFVSDYTNTPNEFMVFRWEMEHVARLHNLSMT